MDEFNKLTLNDIINNLYKNNKKIVNTIINNGFIDNNINNVIWLSVIKDLMKIIQLIPNINGEEKKKVIINFVNYVIDNDLDNENKDLIKSLVNSFLPDTIDILVDLWKGTDYKRLLNNCLCC